jgi:hypothetical protein
MFFSTIVTAVLILLVRPLIPSFRVILKGLFVLLLILFLAALLIPANQEPRPSFFEPDGKIALNLN